MENVEGLIRGEAWTYVQRIYAEFKAIGYRCNHWLCKGEHMGIPQKRHRVFFVALREDVNYNLDFLDMSFNYEPITFGEIKTPTGTPIAGEKTKHLADNIEFGDLDLSYVNGRLFNRPNSRFNSMVIYDDKVNYTVTAKNTNVRYDTREFMSILDVIHSQTFPEDYDFGSDNLNNVVYICGMSVPPVMIKRIVQRLLDNGVL